MTNEEAIEELSVLWERMKRAKENGVLAYKTIMFYDGQYVESLDLAIEALEQTRWIPVSERLPEENEYIGDVCKYYLIQDEYGDMHVAHLSNVGWIPMGSLKAIGDEIIAWMPLPEPYEESEDKE